MAITLQSIAAPGVTPIANNAASAKAFAANYFKLAVPNLSNQDRRMILVLGMIYLVADAGTVNYKTNHKGLIQDAAVFTAGISNIDVFAALAALITSEANTITPAPLSLDVNTLLAEGRDLDNLSEDELDRILALLFAQLGI